MVGKTATSLLKRRFKEHFMTISKIKQLHEMLVNREISCVELTQKYIDAIKATNDSLNAYVLTTESQALAAAKAVDERLANGEEIGLLEGIPMTLKDNISTDGIETTCCSKILKGYVPIYDAFVWDKLKKDGILIAPADVPTDKLENPKALNTMLLGALSAKLPVKEEIWLEVLTESFPEKIRDLNLKMFELGRNA